MAEQNHLFPPNRPLPTLRPPELAFHRRPGDVDKFACGRVVVVGGALGMAGAPALSSMAALRSGAGLVELHVPEPVVTIAASFHPCVMTRGHAASEEGSFARSAFAALTARAERADAFACGPGLGRTPEVVELVQLLWRECPAPAVFDADSLWALATLERNELATHAGPRLLTPHSGELQRFLRSQAKTAHTPPRPRPELEAAAVSLAAEIDAVVVLKGPRSLVTDGHRCWHNTSGNPGMATAGSGDVLTGVAAALCGHGLETFPAAQLGVWVHGLAGDLAAKQVGQTSLIATDIIEHLPAAFLTLEQMADDDHSPAGPSG
ncbi:MAG: NAD(P)H-hydrate dehydratase [Pirellulales bacterium]|nr:NAD(P)H-hydrate dehydratase [Pirellulales bacterium]